jgi:glycosyltransferase involved in cell wall biosynthesis
MLRGWGTPVRLDVYGADAEAAARLAAFAAEQAPEGVHVAPQPTPVEEIPARLEAADLGVVPTLRDDFTEMLLPVKLLEYVHMGLPVVASRLPVIERYFGDDVLLAEPGDAASFAAAIEGVRSAPESALARAEGASERLARIEWRRQREQYLELVDGLVEHARSS